MAQCIYKETEQRSGHDKGSLLRFSPQLHYSGWDRRTDLSGQEKATIQVVAQFSAWFSDINKTSPTYSMPFPSACYTVHIILLLSKALQAISCTTTYPFVYSPTPHTISVVQAAVHTEWPTRWDQDCCSREGRQHRIGAHRDWCNFRMNWCQY